MSGSGNMQNKAAKTSLIPRNRSKKQSRSTIWHPPDLNVIRQIQGRFIERIDYLIDDCQRIDLVKPGLVVQDYPVVKGGRDDCTNVFEANTGS